MSKNYKAWSAVDGSFGVGANGEDICKTKNWEDAELIARALRTQEAIDESFSDSLGFDFTAKLGEAAVHAVKDNLVSDAARGLRVLAAFREAVK